MPRSRPLVWAVPLVIGAGAALLGGREALSGPSPSSGPSAPSASVATEASSPTLVSREPPGRTDDPTTLRPRRTSVAMVGDSLTEGLEVDLGAAARRYGFEIDIDAHQGRRVEEGLDALRHLAPDHDLVVVALGTNDTLPDLTVQEAGARIDEVMAALGPSTAVLWVNVDRTDGDGAAAAAARFNVALTAAVRRHQNLTVGDWVSFIRDRPDLRAADGIHLTVEGYQVRSGWLAALIAERLRLSQPVDARAR
jgi:hypothetical protein